MYFLSLLSFFQINFISIIFYNEKYNDELFYYWIKSMKFIYYIKWGGLEKY